MAEAWLYTVGGIIIGMIVFTIGYQLVTSSINQLQTQSFISDFGSFETDINSLCLQERGTTVGYDFTVPYNVRVIYATDDTEKPLLAVTDRIKNMEMSSGSSLCFQFKEEQDLRCTQLECEVSIPYLGALETYNDLQMMVNKILGKPLSKTYEIEIERGIDSVAIDINLEIVTTTVAGTTTPTVTTTPTMPSEFTLLFIQLDGMVDNFESKTEKAKDDWISLTPLSDCPEKVNKIIVADKFCNVPDQRGICEENQNTLSETIEKIRECVGDWGYDDSYVRIVGVVPGSEVCMREEGALEGYTIIGSDWVVSAENSIDETALHELGHTFGLCDEGYGSFEYSTCDSDYCAGGGSGCEVQPDCWHCCPNYPEENSFMCSVDLCSRGCSYAKNFAPSSYVHLEGELDSYCR
jgi:hypothetical protein